MRALAIGIVTVIGLAGSLAAGLWAGQVGAVGIWAVGPATMAASVAILAMSLTWSLPGDPRRDARWRPRDRWTRLLCTGGALAAGTWLVALLLAQSVAPLAALALGVAPVVYVQLALALGERLRRREEGRAAAPLRSGPGPALVGAAAGFAVAAVLAIALGTGPDAFDPVVTLGFALQAVVLGALAGSLARIFPLAFAANRALGTDPRERRVITKALMRGRPVPDGLHGTAARYAAIGSRSHAWFIAMFSLLYVTNVANNASRLLDDDFGAVSLLIVIGMTLVWAVLLPVLIRQQRRLARYSDEHPVPTEQPA